MPDLRRLAPLAFTLLACPLLACTDGGPNSRSTFITSAADDADEVGSSDSESSSASETSGSDSESSSTNTESSSTSTDSDSSDTGAPICERQRYTFNQSNEIWSAIPLDQDWVGVNAPPCSIEVLGATYIGAWSELVVVGADQLVYRRRDGIWQAPVAWADSFAVLVGKQPTAALHVPNLDDPNEVTLYFMLAGGEAALYTYSSNGGAVLADLVQLMDGAPPAAPQASQDVRWAFTLADTGLVPDADWLVWFMNYTDGFLYRFNAAFDWVRQPQGANDYFGTGQADEPDPSQIEAAYADVELGRVYFIGP